MKRTKILILVAVASLLIALAVRANHVFARFSRVQHQFGSVHVGDSRASVVVGKPNYYSGACGIIQPARTALWSTSIPIRWLHWCPNTTL